MTTEINSLILEHLRALRSDLSDVKDRVGRMELRLSTIEQTLGAMYALSGSDREALHAVTRRVERIERRLDLVE